jgi:hypothetical protein
VISPTCLLLFVRFRFVLYLIVVVQLQGCFFGRMKHMIFACMKLKTKAGYLRTTVANLEVCTVDLGAQFVQRL